MAEIDNWVEAQEFQITLDAQGKIIDYIDNETRRPNTPEERIRQKWFKFFIVNLAIHLLTSVLKEVLISDVMSNVLI